MGESVVIFGSGGIGLSIIQGALSVSANPIIAVDIYENRLKLAKNIGATHLINSTRKDPFKEIEKILGKNNLNVFIDNTGIPEIIENGYSVIKGDGRLILVGVPKNGEKINIFSLPLHFGKILTGSHGGECDPDKDIPRYLNHIISNRLNINDLISQRIKLEMINNAIDSMNNGDTEGRILISF